MHSNFEINIIVIGFASSIFKSIKYAIKSNKLGQGGNNYYWTVYCEFNYTSSIALSSYFP